MTERLDEKHCEELHASGISDEMIDAAGIYSAEGPDIKVALGWQPKKTPWGRGFVIPFRFDGEAQATYHRVKLDFPHHDKKDDAIKYESPYRLPNRVYYPPGFWEAIRDPGTPIIITEGEKKSLSAMSRGLACIGLVGVWGFTQKRPRRQTGRATGPRILIDDLNRIHWHGRKVYIIFDSDAAENPNIRKAERSLAALLSGRGAMVRVVRLPQIGDGKTGLDDFLVHHGDAGANELRKLLAKADSDPEAQLKQRYDDGKLPPMDLADELISASLTQSDGYTARFWRGEFHVWNGRRYRSIAEGDFVKGVLVWLDGQVDGVKPRLAHQVGECVGARLLVSADVEQPVWLHKTGGYERRLKSAAPGGLPVVG
jgi:putative DNA primase/helicase